MENKDINENKKGKKIGIICIVSIIILAILTVGIYIFLQYTNKQVIPNIVVTAGTDINDLIMTEGIFKIRSDIETTKEYISKTISVEPNIEYDINMVNAKEYEIIPKNDLSSNSIYNVVYTNDNEKYKWSFQTKKMYNTTGIYPTNESMDVSPNSVIELFFSYIPNDDIEKYFEISPSVEGKFEYDERKIRFIPTTKLQSSAKYVVTIKNGFGNKENEDVLLKDIQSVFYTSYNNYEIYPIDINNVFTFKSGSKIELPFIYPSYTRDITDVKLQVYKYNNENEFATGVNKQMEIVSYNSLVPISTRGLTKIIDVKYSSKDIRDGIDGYDKIIDIDTILDEGYYLATIQENNRTYYVNIQVNDLMGYVTYFDDKALVWVNSVDTNSVVSNATVYRNGEAIGNTNSQGYLEVSNFKRKIGNYNNECIKVEKDTQLPLYMFFSDWYNDESMYTKDQNVNVYSFIDRVKYRQNEQVKLWGFIKHRNSIEYNNVSIELCYSDYTTVLETKQVPIDEFGSFATEFDLSGYDNGYYYFKVYINGKILSCRYFEIRQYDTKNYNVDAKLNKNVVFAGEDLQLDVLVTLFDGTPISDTEFKYSYFYGENKKSGTLKTNSNGVATVMLDTNYKTQYSSVVYGNLQIWNDGKEAEYETQYIQFMLLPKKENYTLECKYDRQKDVYVFNATSYMYDKSSDKYVGEPTNRDITIKIDKYKKVKVLDYTKYNEDTKTNEEVYKTEKQYIGNEEIKLVTQSGEGSIEYKNPIGSDIDGYITYASSMPMQDKDIIVNTNYTYINGLQDYTTGSVYTIDYDDKKYKVGDTVNIKVLKNEENITTPINILHIIKSIKGTQIIYTQDPIYSFTFTKDYGTDITVKTYVFDGLGIYSANQYAGDIIYSLDKSELQLDIDISFDKAAYKPGEEATITVITKHKGIPVEASVNICAVDNSYLAYYSNQTDIINALYNYYYFTNNNDFVSHQIWGIFGGGGEGGAGDERSQFATTAFFENVLTNSNGKATLKIKWPDNITSWGVLAQGVSKEYTAGQILKDISVTLPFFVTPIYEDTYLVNEEPNINIRANGVNVKNGDEVQYTVTLTLPDGTSIEQNISSNVGQYAQYQLPNLLPGSYELKIYGRCNDYSDTVIRSFDVVESNLTTRQLKDLELEKNKKIEIQNNIAKLYLYNTSTQKIIDELLELSNLPNIRNDQMVISKLASEMLNELSHNQYTDFIDSKFFDDGGIELIDNAPKDVILTAKILSTGYSNIYKEGMIDYLQTYIQDDSIDLREKLFALWGLASLKEPILIDLKELKETISTDAIFERLVLGLAYADIGDFDNANKILQQIISNITTSNKEVYEFATILAIKLNYVDVENMYNEYLNLGRETEYTNFVKLYYIQNQLLNNVKNASITLNINSKDVIYDLKEIGLTILEIRQKDNVIVKKIDKNIGAKIEQYRTIDKTISNSAISKEYLVNDVKTNTFNVGDIVKTRIHIDYSKLEEDIQYFSIEDILPNCMVYLQNDIYETYNPNVIKSPIDINGNKLTFVVSLYNNRKPYIEYEARVISTGKYVSDGTILKGHNNVIHDYFSAGNIEVK